MMILFILVATDFMWKKVGSTYKIIKMRCMFAKDFRY
jgi:hypothetical protein